MNLTRRRVSQFAGTLALCSFPLVMRLARAQSVAGAAQNLLTAPIELAGNWGGSPPAAALRVITRVRDVCLNGVRLVSDRQPGKIRVDDHSSGSPAIWLHDDRTSTAWVIVDIGARDWCKLAYQFGHELGHVLCNSWSATSAPAPPSQWFEESLVEAFSIRGLGRLATSWTTNPPFAGDNAFAMPIRQYRQNIIDTYAKEFDRASYADLGKWFRKSRNALEHVSAKGPAVLAILAEYEKDDTLVADLGAVNRWPQRTRVPIEDYLALWVRSCAQLGAPGGLPVRIRSLLRL